MAGKRELHLVDLSSPDRASTAASIRQACVDSGFFYLINHGIEDETFQWVFSESRKFFSLPLDEKMKLEHNEHHTGYTPMYAETLDPSSAYKAIFALSSTDLIMLFSLKLEGDLKESFYIGPVEGNKKISDMNQWPSEADRFCHHEGIIESLPFWRTTMESYHKKVLTVGRRIVSLIALALNLDDQFFEKIGAMHDPMAFVRLLHYPGEVATSDKGNYGASAHSDYGMVTLLATDGVPGLQICREKDSQPQVWEDVHHVHGAMIVNVGDMLERWTNCQFRSTLHRVLATGQERYSVAFFLDPNDDCVVECLKSCCSEMSPPRFPPIRSGDYLQERLKITYSK